MSREINPISKNRQKAWKMLVKNANNSEWIDVIKNDIRRSSQKIDTIQTETFESDFAKQSSAAIASSSLGAYLLINELAGLDAQWCNSNWQKIIEALSVGYHGFELTYQYALKEPRLYIVTDTIDYYHIAFHASLTGLGIWRESDSLCRYLLNIWLSDAIDERLHEQGDFIAFYWYLLRAQYKNEWPKMDELQMDLGEFKLLFETVGDEAAFEKAVIEYGDFRLARAHGYASQHATRRNNDLISDALTYGPLCLFPAELLAFKAIYERTTGKLCSLKSDHPVLNSVLMDPPQDLKLIENETTTLIDEIGQSIYGGDWELYRLGEVYWENQPWSDIEK